MPSVVSAIRDTVPITQFNRGLAGQIFEDVKTHGAKVVMKNNCLMTRACSPLRLSAWRTSTLPQLFPKKKSGIGSGSPRMIWIQLAR